MRAPSQAIGPFDEPRLAKRVMDELIDRIRVGLYPVSSRLPAERKLANEFLVSRPVVREALMALELLGIIGVRVGSGSYVKMLPVPRQHQDGCETPFELLQAAGALLGECGRLAASASTLAEVAELADLASNASAIQADAFERRSALGHFHKKLLSVAHNAVLADLVATLWYQCLNNSELTRMVAEAQKFGFRPENMLMPIVVALQQRDGQAAAEAVRAYYLQWLARLLEEHERLAVEAARESVHFLRRRYGTQLP